MAQPKKIKKKDVGELVRCLRCGKTSPVQLVAKCGYCGSFAVKLIRRNTHK